MPPTMEEQKEIERIREQAMQATKTDAATKTADTAIKLNEELKPKEPSLAEKLANEKARVAEEKARKNEPDPANLETEKPGVDFNATAAADEARRRNINAERASITEDTVLTEIQDIPTGQAGTFMVPEKHRERGSTKFYKSSFPTFNFIVDNGDRHAFVRNWFVTNSRKLQYYLEENYIDRKGIPMRIEEATKEEYFKGRTLDDAGIVTPVIEPLPSSARQGGFHTGPTSSVDGVIRSAK